MNSFATASYSPSLVPSYPPPIPLFSGLGQPAPLTSFALPEEALAEAGGFLEGGGGGGGFISKFLLTPLLLLLPLAVVAVAVALGAGVLKLLGLKKLKFGKRSFYADEHQADPSDLQQPFNIHQLKTGSRSRTAREAAESSASPSLTMDQVDSLTSIVLAALHSQECAQRLLCEAGSLGRSLPLDPAVARAVDQLVPESMKTIFVAGENCNRFVCGSEHGAKEPQQSTNQIANP